MWTFVQRTGEFLKPTGQLLARGYSGHWDGNPPVGGPNDHRNKPGDQALIDRGPIPAGTYAIGAAYNDPGGKGPIVMALTPAATNRMFGRSDFLIHGDRAPPLSGTASDGCIILDHDSRATISASIDRVLQVISEPPAVAASKGLAPPVSKKAKKRPKPKPERKQAARKSPLRGKKAASRKPYRKKERGNGAAVAKKAIKRSTPVKRAQAPSRSPTSGSAKSTKPVKKKRSAGMRGLKARS